jgi:hypothetical protein
MDSYTERQIVVQIIKIGHRKKNAEIKRRKKTVRKKKTT